MTDEQFKQFMVQMQAQTDAIRALTDKVAELTEKTAMQLQSLAKTGVLQAALEINKTHTVENEPVQEAKGLHGAIDDIQKYVETSNTPPIWDKSVTSEIFVKTFSSKPLKLERI